MKFAVPKQKVDFFIKILGSLAAPLVNVFLLVPWYENTKTFAPNIGLTIVGWLSTMLLCLILKVWPKPYIWSSRIAEKLLSWVDWLMSDSIKWLVLTFSGFVQLSKMWWGTKTCWLNDWSDWLRRGGALGQRGCGGAGYWLEVIQHFRCVIKLQISQFTEISTWLTVA